MPYTFELPEVGEGVVEAEIVKWLVQPGARVERDQPVCEITTDKAQIEVSSPRSGTVAALHGKPGDIVKVHAPLMEIDESGSAPAPKPAPTPRTEAPAAPRAAAAPAASTASGPTRAAPAVRRHAREVDVDIHAVPGTGPAGRVTHGDVAAAAEVVAAPLPVAPAALAQVHPTGHEERVPVIGIRRRIAEQMVRAKQTAPHFTYVEEVDVTGLVALREGLKKRAADRGVSLTYLPFVMKATSIVLRDFPNVNAVMDEAKMELVVKSDHHFGLATDTPQGLFVPVVRNVEQKSILRIAADMADLTDRTRKGKAKLDELRGGTLTFTSVGNIGGVFATPILNVPEVAIIGVNTIRDRAMVVDGAVAVRKMMYLSPSFDHRIIDGAVGARFVAALKALLEHPEQLLLDLA
jgi:pyruvate dehydrogenase E2 component (dihydrolipoamide acetyltransferase)